MTSLMNEIQEKYGEGKLTSRQYNRGSGHLRQKIIEHVYQNKDIYFKVKMIDGAGKYGYQVIKKIGDDSSTDFVEHLQDVVV